MADWAVASPFRCAFAESPRWDSAHNRLLWIDMLGDSIHALDAATGAHSMYQTGRPLSAVVPRAGGGVVAVVADGVALLDELGAIPADVVRIEVGPLAPLNDACCDTRGRLWTASGARGLDPPVGAVWRIDGDLRVTKASEGVDHPNGLGFSPDGKTLYHAESLKGHIEAYPLDDVRTLGNPQVIARVDRSDGLPDGLAVDAEGGIWVALYDGAQVRRYAPDGSLDAVIQLPVPWITSCAFGGAGLDLLFVTTGRDDDSRSAGDSIAGTVLVVEPGVVGAQQLAFAG